MEKKVTTNSKSRYLAGDPAWTCPATRWRKAKVTTAEIVVMLDPKASQIPSRPLLSPHLCFNPDPSPR